MRWKIGPPRLKSKTWTSTLTELKRICLTPRTSGVGGMVSFQAKFAAGLAARGIEVTYDLGGDYDAVLITGGTRNLRGLWRAKRRGVPIVQRLDGINWLHRILPTGWKHYLRAEYGNWLLSFIRKTIATHIVYQSQFVVEWWGRKYGPTPIPYTVVHNGVDLDAYTPEGTHARPESHYRLLLVEGSLGGGYEMGLETAVHLAERLQDEHELPIELSIVGKVSPELKKEWNQHTPVTLHWAGLQPREAIPEIDRSAHLLYSGDINAACPNAVIEALACGLPVLAFDTGALNELVPPSAGAVIPYGGDPWQLAPPDVPALAIAAARILKNQAPHRAAARTHAQTHLDLNLMIDNYLQAIQHKNN